MENDMNNIRWKTLNTCFSKYLGSKIYTLQDLKAIEPSMSSTT